MINEDSLVSIAMCTYNGEEFIIEQLESILTQTYTNIELIISDDGSTDRTIEIVKSYQKKDKRIQLYQNQKNLGFVKNFEKAIGLCVGDYIALADQDDIWKNKKLQIFLEQIKDNLLIYSDAEIINKASQNLGRTLVTSSLNNLVKGQNSQAFFFDNCVSGNTLMFKKELLETILPIPSKLVPFHDIWITFVASSLGTITYTDIPMTYYRRYDGQITSNKQKIVHDSFISRVNSKKQKIEEEVEKSLARYNFFLTLPFIRNETKILLSLLTNHYSTFDNGYFNFKLYKYLHNNRDTIFKIKPIHKRIRYARNISMKLNLHKLLFFTT